MRSTMVNPSKYQAKYIINNGLFDIHCSYSKSEVQPQPEMLARFSVNHCSYSKSEVQWRFTNTLVSKFIAEKMISTCQKNHEFSPEI